MGRREQPYVDGVVSQDSGHASCAVGDEQGVIGAQEGGGIRGIEAVVVP